MSEGDKDLIFTGCANGLNPLDPLGPIFWLIDDKGALSSQKTLKRKTKQVSSWQHNRAGQRECYLFIFVVMYIRQSVGYSKNTDIISIRVIHVQTTR